MFKRAIPSYIGEEGQVSNWLFYNGAGDKLFDFSGEKNHGVIYGPKWIDGPYGWSLDFDGSDDYVEVPHSASLDITSAITVMAWIKVDTWGDYNQLVCKRDGTDASWTLEQNSTNKYFDFAIWDGGTADKATMTTTLSAGTWYYLAATYDGDTIKIYLNGDLAASTSHAGSIDSTTTPVNIGQLGDDTHWFDGLQTIVRVYNLALAGSVISEHFQSTRGIFGV